MCAGDFRSIRNDRSACEGFCILQAFPIRHWIERSILLRRMWRFGMTCESLVMSYLEDSTFRRHQENWKNHWLPLEYIWHCPLWCTSVGHFFKGIARLIATQTLEVLSSVQYQKESNSEQWVGGSLSHIFAYPVSASKLELTRQNLKSD